MQTNPYPIYKSVLHPQEIIAQKVKLCNNLKTVSYRIQKFDPSLWPQSLSEIPQPPKNLYLVGAWPEDTGHVYLTVVGARKYSTYGKEVCEHLISELAGYPIIIVSGLAIGIDTIAHESALASGLKTLAFPGSGLDPKVLYPRNNQRLAQKIIDAGGGLISEFDPLFRATPYSFPQRNRLMAGLAQATLIIEAERKSGTLITARLALDYNRELLAVPGSIFNQASVGPNWLITQGATPVTSSEDILRALNLYDEDPQNGQEKLFTDLSPVEQSIYDLLRLEPLSRDSICEKLSSNASELNSILSIMEIKGIIKETMGEFWLS